MAQVEFTYNGVNTIIQCQLNDKMKDICQKFKDKENIKILNIFYTYSGKIINEEEIILSLAKTINDAEDETNLKNLNIANQGGEITFRSCVETNKTIKAEQIDTIESTNEEITKSITTGLNHNATIIEKAGITAEEIEYQISFEIVIELENSVKYKAILTLDLPNENLNGEKVTAIEKTELEDIVFKRMNFSI